MLIAAPKSVVKILPFTSRGFEMLVVGQRWDGHETDPEPCCGRVSRPAHVVNHRSSIEPLGRLPIGPPGNCSKTAQISHESPNISRFSANN